MTYSILLSSRALQNFMEVIAVLAIALSFVSPRFGRRIFRRLESGFDHLARNPRHAIVAAALFPIIVRALLLPVFPMPLPRVHDEFSYLLLGDTLAHGRLANPSPPEWRHFETEYELVRPVYASQYQPAQGVFLAIGEVVTGYPWWGVWLSVGVMCGALCWALQAFLPNRWALFGAVIAALQFGIYGFWMNSYFGGAVAAIGGALVFGSMLRRRPPICAIGLLILFASRPVEAFLWLVTALVFWRANRPVPRLAAVGVVILTAGIGALACYNLRITGDAAKPPYELYREDYGTPQSYWWQPPVVVTHFDNPELRKNYENQLHFWERRYSLPGMWDSTWRRLRDFWRFFIGPFLTPALLFAVWLVRSKKLRPWLFASALFTLDHATYHAWYPQQSAAETVLIVLLVVECWRRLRAWSRERGFGIAISRHLIAGFGLAILLVTAGHALEPVLPDSLGGQKKIWASLYPAPQARDFAIQRLERLPGKHLVFVHYRPTHPWYDEWVFNPADIPNASVVFARMCDPDSDAALARRFPDRHVWIADPDGRTLTPISDRFWIANVRLPN